MTRRGLDAGAETIAAHLATNPSVTKVPAVSTIWRILSRRGFVTPQPHKRPRSSWKRFQADMPNQCWQADVTHWHLAAGGGVEILNVIDDHSRLALAGLARRSIGGPDVLTTFAAAFTTWGHPQSVLTDNGAIFTGQPRRGGRTALEITLGTLGIKYLTSRPYHPQTCGKIERFPQTQKKRLTAHPATTLTQLQDLLDEFCTYYNTARPHRALGRATPIQAFKARPKATPSGYLIPAHCRVRTDTIDAAGVMFLALSAYCTRLLRAGSMSSTG